MRTLVDEFNNQIDEQIDLISDRVIKGGCANQEEYRSLTGQNKAFHVAKHILADILKRRLGEDDDTESHF